LAGLLYFVAGLKHLKDHQRPVLATFRELSCLTPRGKTTLQTVKPNFREVVFCVFSITSREFWFFFTIFKNFYANLSSNRELSYFSLFTVYRELAYRRQLPFRGKLPCRGKAILAVYQV